MSTTPTEQQAAPAEQQAPAEQPQEQSPQSEQQPATGEQLGSAGEAALKAEREARKAAEKARKTAERELAEARQQNMSDAEKAVHEAEARGRSAAAAEYGARLARAKFDALAGRRNPEANTDEVLEFVDLRQFVDEQGELDEKMIQSAVEKLVPERGEGIRRSPTFDSGVRNDPPKATDMNAILRQGFAGRG